MDTTVLAVFVFVYIGMILGEIPGLALDRTGVALLGTIALLVMQRITPIDAWNAVDVSTIGLLLGLMVVSAQFRLGGFYAKLTRGLAAMNVSTGILLALLIAVSGVLSALLANDIVCLAMAPVLVEGCVRRRLNPVPFLLALACASNVGSAATLIGNPQNMLIGQVLHLSFSRYLLQAGVPSAVGLIAVWVVVRQRMGGRVNEEVSIPVVEAPDFNLWQTTKGFLVLTALVFVFLLTSWPREVVALAAAGLLLTSRRMASRDILGLVDWHLLVLFVGLFVVNHVVAESSILAQMMSVVNSSGINLAEPEWLFAVTVVLSNLVSNVPATMLLLPVATHPLAGPVLALASTLAGNLFIVGSIANIIVVDQADRLGVRITWWEHAKVGVPVTVLTLAIAAGWLWLLSRFFPSLLV
ncbi:MAG: anion transporter [Candidatus Abyssobacteria bacterium SURF_17]|uniref:Anion transporter n=1 Tax=Candidatus Abyssobacteria bacterium SURF_17 TaxID=2093361 RepID=A0A419F349_9BACT|nr:MAG: anion transporter [Candidatus Abyssubacteria bacterium SURF_17]